MLTCFQLQNGWMCPRCTFLNEPTRPGCEACCADRPDDYVVPQGHLPSEAERLRLDREQQLEEVTARLLISHMALIASRFLNA